MKARIRTNGIIMCMALLVVLIFPTLFFRTRTTSSLDEIAEISGIVLILFGQLLRISARGYKSEHSQNSKALVQGGPYALVRNPMYLGILCIGVGVTLILFNMLVLGIFLVVFIVRYLLLILKEEKKLLATFPHDYPGYCRRVPRLVPRFSALLEKDVSGYLPLKPSWIKKEIVSTLVVLLLVFSIEAWGDIRTEGTAAYFKEALWLLVIITLFIFLLFYLSRRTNNVAVQN